MITTFIALKLFRSLIFGGKKMHTNSLGGRFWGQKKMLALFRSLIFGAKKSIIVILHVVLINVYFN